MRKLGRPSPGTSRNLTADEARATGLSRGTILSNEGGEFYFYHSAYGQNYRGKLGEQEKIFKALRKFWQRRR